MNPFVKTLDISKEPTCGQLDDRLPNLFPEDQRTNDGMLHVGHWWHSVKWERLRWVDGIYLLYLDSHYPRRDQPITSLATIKVLLIQPTPRSEDPLRYRYHWIVLCHDSHNPLCLPTYVLCLAFFFVTIASYCTFISRLWRFCLLSAPLWVRCLHIPYCYLFSANWSVRSPALNL